MGEGTSDRLKGRAKEQLGDLTDDRDLEREGTADKAAGNVKDKLGDLKDRVESAVDEVVDQVKERLHRG